MSTLTQTLAAYAIGEKERALLRELRDALEDRMEDVLDAFYGFALGDAQIKAFFPSDQIVEHARKRQKEHWMMMLDGSFNEAYLQSAKTIGQVHYRIQLPFQFYMSAYARAASDLSRLAAKKMLGKVSFGGKHNRAADALTVLSRTMFLDAELVIQAYFDAQSEEQTQALDAISEELGAIAGGQPATRIAGADTGGTFPVRYDALRKSFNGAVDALATVNEQLVPMITSLGLSSNEVSSAVESLAGRTEQQGHALAETAMSLRDLSESVKESAESAGQVDSEAQNASTDARKAGEVVKLAVEAMEKIEGSSKTIAERITSINEIAFQTNLLALNAAVEAAQAGEAGRGFAIVAGEVRLLAERASQTASEVEQIIQESATSVASGVERVGQTGEALDRIIGNVVTVSDLITQVTQNTKEQSQKLEGIRTSIDQLETVTQANVAMVEETTAAALDLGRTQDEIRTVLSGFGGQGDDDGGRATSSWAA